VGEVEEPHLIASKIASYGLAASLD